LTVPVPTKKRCEGGDKGYEVGIERGLDAVAGTRDGRVLDGAAHANLLAEALEDEDGRVCRRRDRQDHARKTGQRKGKEPVVREQGEETEVEGREDRERTQREQPEPTIEEEQVDNHDGDADGEGGDTLGEGVLAKRGADDAGSRST